MPNPVLDRLAAERARQISFVDEMLARAAADERDLVDAELSNLTATRERIAELDAQIGPMAEFDALRDTHAAATAAVFAPQHPQQPRQLAGPDRRAPWVTAGSFIVDYIAGRGLMANRQGQRLPADPDAMGRVQYALQNQTTGDTPGLLPEPIVGDIVSIIDASRPLITSLGGARPMGGIPGKTFGRPKVTQHVQVGPQSAEKAELPSRKMTIGEVSFTKATYGGAVDVSRQDIDWTSPAAWDILVRDLADVYAQETENAAADAFAAAADDFNTAPTVPPSNDLVGWSTALYQAAEVVYASSKRLPNRLWISTDIWSSVGPILDTACCAGGTGSSGGPTTFGGNMLTIPRVVVPSFPAGTAVLGWDGAFEVYEEVIGLLTAVEPSLLGVEVAYGGYIAYNAVVPEALALIGAPTGGATARQTASKSS